MRSKNVINNKNIIQICYEKVKRKKRKQPSQSQSQSQAQYNESSNVGKGLNIQPSFVNFPNSSRLEPDDRRVRFMEAMRNPFSTKSPYSIYDNGSNTFQREGNTTGVEQEIQPQLSQDDYFQEPRSFMQPPVRPESRQPQRFQVASPISPISPIGAYDENAGKSWFRPNLYTPLEEDESVDAEEEGSVYEAQKSFSRFDANTPAPPPTFSSPYRAPETQEQLRLDPVEVDDEETKRAFEKFDQELKDLRSQPKFQSPFRGVQSQEEEDQLLDERLQQEMDAQRERQRQEKEKQKQAYIELSDELDRKKDVRQKFKTISTKLQELIDTGERKVKKNSDLKNEIIEFLKDPEFKEYTGPKNIRNLSDAKSILEKLKTNSTQVIEEIKQIEADSKETPIKRDPPKSRANLQILKSLGKVVKDRGKAGGGGAYSKLPISSR
jgi:hypothetical protein